MGHDTNLWIVPTYVRGSVTKYEKRSYVYVWEYRGMVIYGKQHKDEFLHLFLVGIYTFSKFPLWNVFFKENLEEKYNILATSST